MRTHAVGAYKMINRDPDRFWTSCTCGWDTTGKKPKTVVRRRDRHINKANKWEANNGA